MAVNLSKGQKISLDKGMTLALVGLGWDTNRYSGGAEFDLDASAFLLGANGKVRKDEDFIFYGNLKSADGSVTHTGDNCDPQIRTDINWKTLIGQASGESYAYEWGGNQPVTVIVQPSERKGGIRLAID